MALKLRKKGPWSGNFLLYVSNGDIWKKIANSLLIRHSGGQKKVRHQRAKFLVLNYYSSWCLSWTSVKVYTFFVEIMKTVIFISLAAIKILFINGPALWIGPSLRLELRCLIKSNVFVWSRLDAAGIQTKTFNIFQLLKLYARWYFDDCV